MLYPRFRPRRISARSASTSVSVTNGAGRLLAWAMYASGSASDPAASSALPSPATWGVARAPMRDDTPTISGLSTLSLCRMSWLSSTPRWTVSREIRERCSIVGRTSATRSRPVSEAGANAR
jgi:hypothetical protein